ncbi:membrane protease YdiL (CAAX protease family) [Microbacterium keratanolyticum]|uniref:Abortive infection protein n=1 Tax=Microbacterium keratanolyticum TaxID=67574 RepID=A0A9W6HTW0_9MICO|nr:type II CAAX endopeptidase family protein [Microbacterium keratanolyticum]MBM7469811.1 membrane protease YdiL (CAAX protease family) [Microbacterium keratanolyticum]GLK01890.1 abortive infection protein [Microbacterium keratanolyticum]
MTDSPAHSLRTVPWGAVALFVVTACALAWLVALPLWLGEGLAAPIAPLLLPLMMWTPAVATLIVMLALRVPAKGERVRFLGLWPLRPAKRVVWLIVVGWLAPVVLIVLIVAVSALFGLAQPDFTFSAYAALLESATPARTPLPPVEALVVAQLAMVPLGALINSVAAFGEEIGWRGWLLPALRPLGTWPALVLSGAIWGLWHAPIILLGYNFGRTDITGVLFMMGGCVAWGVFFGWLRLRSGSVWPAVVGHGALNAAAGLILLLQPIGTPFDLAIVGPLGVVSWGVLAVVALVLALTGQFRTQPELALCRERVVAPPAVETPAP